MHLGELVFHIPASNGNRTQSAAGVFPDKADLLDGGANVDDVSALVDILRPQELRDCRCFNHSRVLQNDLDRE